MGLQPASLPAVLPRALTPCSTARQEEAIDPQPRATIGPVSRLFTRIALRRAKLRRPQCRACYSVVANRKLSVLIEHS